MATKSKPRKKAYYRKAKSAEPVLTASQLSEIQNELKKQTITAKARRARRKINNVRRKVKSI